MNIKKIIREEMDDFDWIHDIEPNKWEVFESMVEKNPNIIIKKDISTDVWYDFVDGNDIPYFGDEDFFYDNGLYRDIKENDMSDFIDALTQLIEVSFDEIHIRENDRNYLDFMELKRILEYIDNQQINESDDKDLKWIEDIESGDYSFIPGDKIIVHNIGNETSFLEWLGSVKNQENYKNGVFGENITGTIHQIYSNDFLLFETNTGDGIYFPLHGLMIKLQQDTYPGLSIYYELVSK